MKAKCCLNSLSQLISHFRKLLLVWIPRTLGTMDFIPSAGGCRSPWAGPSQCGELSLESPFWWDLIVLSSTGGNLGVWNQISLLCALWKSCLEETGCTMRQSEHPSFGPTAFHRLGGPCGAKCCLHHLKSTTVVHPSRNYLDLSVQQREEIGL